MKPAIHTPALSAPGLPELRLVLARLAAWTLRAAELRRQRRALGELDAHLLRDIGVSPIDARREVERPFWQHPEI